MKATGRNTATRERVVARTGEADLARALQGGLEGREASFLHEPVDVLQDDDGVVDHDAHGQGEGQQRDDVQGEPHGPHEAEGAHDEGRDGDGRDHGGAPVAQEDEDHQGGQEGPHHQVLLDGPHRGLDVFRLVAHDGEGVAVRQPGAELGEALLDPVDHGHRVGAGLAPDRQDHGRLPVDVGGRLHVLGAILHLRHVRQADLGPVARGHHQAVELGHAVHAALHAHRQLARALPQVAAGDLKVLVRDGPRHLGHGEVVGAQAGRVHPEVDLARPPAHDGDLAHAGQRLQLAAERLVRELGDLADGPGAREGEVGHGGRVGIHLVDDGGIDVPGQVRQDLVDLVAHLLRGDVHALLELELDEDLRDPLGGDGAQLVDAGDGVDGALDLVRDLRLHVLGGGARLPRGDGDGGEVHLGEAVHPQRDVAEAPHHHEGEDQHRGEDRAPDGDVRQPLHG
jgi:hypothetical protein